jgi:hypothetical protein
LLQILSQKKTAKAQRTQKMYDLLFSRPVHHTIDSLHSLFHSSVLFTLRSLRLRGLFFSVSVAEAAE